MNYKSSFCSNIWNLGKAWQKCAYVHNFFIHQIFDYNITYAIYGYIWWLNFFVRTPLAWKLSRWALIRKTKWLNNYLSRKYPDIYNENNYDKSYETGGSKRIVWVFWGQGEQNMPILVKSCYNQLRRNNKNVILVTMENLNKYILMPTTIINKVENKQISWAFFSDIVRVLLLEKYGGLWLDATVWVPGEIPWDDLEEFTFYSANNKVASKSNDMCFWTSLEYNWSGWCMYSRNMNYALFSFVGNLLKKIAQENKCIPDYVIVDFAIYISCIIFNHVNEDMSKIEKFSCPNKNLLAELMNVEYSDNKYEEIVSNNFVFKLSFRTKWNEYTPDGKETFFGHLICHN